MPPRVIRPKDDSNSSDQPERSTVKQSGRRRAVPSACIPCRRRKSKCDGGLPSCSTCLAVYRTECSYDADVDGRSRSTASRDVQSLQQRNDALDVIVASLRALPETEAITLLQSLRSTPNLDVVAEAARGTTLPTQSLFTRPPGFAEFSPVDNPFAGPFAPPSIPSESPPIPQPSSSSNSQRPDEQYRSRHASLHILQDPDTVRYLLDLYFAWVHPFNELFSRDLFLSDMHNEGSGHFSTLLLYAVLAFACHYTDTLDVQGEHIPAATLSDYCLQQAQGLLASVEKPHITVAQALGIMGIREASRGRDSRAFQLIGRSIRTVIELNLHSATAAKGLMMAELEARQITVWGIYTLETLCAMHIGRSSHFPRHMIDLPKPLPTARDGSIEWHAFGHEFPTSIPQGHMQHPAIFSNCLSSLCELATAVLDTLYSPSQSFTSRSLISAYEKYMHWYANVPKPFWLDSASPPHVVVLHIFFNMCIIGLFRPYMKLDLRGAGLYPRETCTRSANEMSKLVVMLRSTYGLRRVPMITVNCLITASTVHVLNLPSELAEGNLRQAMEDFTTLSTNHSCAINGINLVQSLANRWSVSLPKEVIPVTSPATTMRSPVSNMASLTSPQSSESYGVLYDNLGGVDDLRMASWPNTPIHASHQPFSNSGMIPVTHNVIENDWQHQQQGAQQDSEPGHMHSLAWQWQTH